MTDDRIFMLTTGIVGQKKYSFCHYTIKLRCKLLSSYRLFENALADLKFHAARDLSSRYNSNVEMITILPNKANNIIRHARSMGSRPGAHRILIKTHDANIVQYRCH